MLCGRGIYVKYRKALDFPDANAQSRESGCVIDMLQFDLLAERGGKEFVELGYLFHLDGGARVLVGDVDYMGKSFP